MTGADLRVPKLNTNDESYVLLEWLVDDGEQVRRDDPVASVETSKAVEELVSPGDGVLRRLLPAGASCAAGDLIGRVRPDGDPGPAPAPPEVAAAAGGGSTVVITAPAQALIDELGLDPALVASLGVPVVRRADILALAGPTPARHALSPRQQAIGRTVALSHATIPAAYSVVKVEVDAALAAAGRLTRQLRRLVGLPDLLVAAVARQHAAFPLFFARLVDERTAEPAARPNVGVTFDLGAGLHIPVVPDAATLPVAQIAERLTEYRRLAGQGAFREEQLAGANIVLTLHHDGGIVLAVPMIFPGQVCALALAAPQRELVLDEAGAVQARTVAQIGLAYDHRLVNGRDAALFLHAIRDCLEAPADHLLDRDA
ncbi:2-oxo acid dehydrogenase subunit E2 [Dactylosporangium salmoneum]|uniref:Dihydrolipoamide acetyltransferase component of pyruvate dehydrogenase complex n=1 Tax=Dactylosporangium salmoneum TaxID=53361 RepID=A0ABP5V744_9ACTN